MLGASVCGDYDVPFVSEGCVLNVLPKVSGDDVLKVVSKARADLLELVEVVDEVTVQLWEGNIHLSEKVYLLELVEKFLVSTS